MSNAVLNFTDADVSEILAWAPLIDTLEEAFRRGARSPPRPHFDIEVEGDPAVAEAALKAAAEKLLANTVIENFRVELQDSGEGRS